MRGQPAIEGPNAESRPRPVTGPNWGCLAASRSAAGFTLIELILVMAILTMAVSLTAPTLSNFFRGRALDAEARRLLAMTHGGQNRAVSEGIPMNLWIDADKKLVGLDAEPSYETVDPKAVEFEMDGGLQIEVSKAAPAIPVVTRLAPGQAASTASVPRSSLTHPSLPTIRFLPDGTIGDNSPQKIRLSGRDGASLWLAQTADKLSYEIRHTEQ
jgi:prepilin-type N-terminal cleavage/methylation domain-containing protein